MMIKTMLRVKSQRIENFVLLSQKDTENTTQFFKIILNRHKSGKMNFFSSIYRLEKVLGFADDLVIDIPKIWTYFGEFLGKFMICINFLNHV